jgi:hypothetical protein
MPLLFHYAWNCIWLIVPILGGNVLLMGRLPRLYQPESFSKGIPVWIAAGENALRVPIFALPVLMPLGIERLEQRVGFAVYLVGVALYFLSWAMQIWLPQSAWSRSRWGFMAPAYTPLLWLAGIAFLGNACFLPIPHLSWIYLGLSGLFLCFHNLHAWIVYSRAARTACRLMR